MMVRFQRVSQVEFIASHCSFSQHHPQALTKSSICRWEGEHFRCQLADKATVSQALSSLNYSIEDIPIWASKAINHLESLAQSNINDLDQPGEYPDYSNSENTYDSLLPYQLSFVNVSHQRMCNVILADDTGLGKSISALAAAIEYRQYWPLLILTSTSKKEQWAEFVKSRIIGVSVMVLESSKKHSKNNDDEQQQMLRQKGGQSVVILAYEQALKYTMILQSVEFRIAVVDDAHQLKNYQAQKSQLLLPMIAKIKYKIVIARDIDEWKPKCIYNYLRAVYPFHFRFVKQFMERYCDPQPSAYVENKTEYEGTSNSLEVEYLLSLAVIRRTHEQVAMSIPDINMVRFFIKPTPTRSSRVELMLREMKHKNALEQFQVALETGVIEEQGIYGEILSEIMEIETESKSTSVQKYLQVLINKPPLAINSQPICSLVVFRSEKMRKAIVSSYGSNPEIIYVLHQTVNKLDNNNRTTNKKMNAQQIPLADCYLVHISQIESKKVKLIKQRINHVIFTELDVLVDAVSIVDKLLGEAEKGTKKIKCIYLLTRTGVEQALYRIFYKHFEHKNGGRQEQQIEDSNNGQDSFVHGNSGNQQLIYQKITEQSPLSKTATPMRNLQIKLNQLDTIGKISSQCQLSYSIQKSTDFTPATDKKYYNNYEQQGKEEEEKYKVGKQLFLRTPSMCHTDKKRSCFTQKRLDEYKSAFLMPNQQGKEKGDFEKKITEEMDQSFIDQGNAEDDDYAGSESSFIEKTHVYEEQGQDYEEPNRILSEVNKTPFPVSQELPIAPGLFPSSFEEVIGVYGGLFGKRNNLSGRQQRDNQQSDIEEQQSNLHEISDSAQFAKNQLASYGEKDQKVNNSGYAHDGESRSNNDTLNNVNDKEDKKIFTTSCYLDLESVFTKFLQLKAK